VRGTYKGVARITKAHGNKGKVVAVPVGSLPFVLGVGMHVATVPPEARRSRYHVVTSVEDGPTGQLVGFDNVCDRDASEHLVGTTVLALRSELPDDIDLHDSERLVGREVTDEARGLTGTIREVMTGPANDVWALDVAGEEVLVPVIDDVVAAVPDEGPIPITIPDGLLPGSLA
jgi:16S rRNA processing protein RimM